MSNPILSRPAFVAEARRIFGDSYQERIADLTQTNLRTVQRLGSERNPLDARRLTIMALRLIGHDQDANNLARFCLEQSIELMEEARRQARAQG